MDDISIHEALTKAEKSEKRARELLDELPENISPTSQDEINNLFAAAWQGYHEVERLAREQVALTDSVKAYTLLAQALLDIHIHPNSFFASDTSALWEAQYVWLHLYYRTGAPTYFEQTKLCDAIRHASVEIVAHNQK